MEKTLTANLDKKAQRLSTQWSKSQFEIRENEMQDMHSEISLSHSSTSQP